MNEEMYIRFVILGNDPNSGRRQGLFHALGNLSADEKLHPHEQEIYDRIREWFNRNLEKPASFSRSSKPRAKDVAISWFKDTAKKHIAQMRTLVEILKSHGILTEMISTDRQGYIVYEDEYQIAAEPFGETKT